MYSNIKKKGIKLAIEDVNKDETLLTNMRFDVNYSKYNTSSSPVS